MALIAPTRGLRHTRRNPCPVCGGGDDDPRGQRRRCHGFTSSDRRYAHCSREELAGALLADRNGNTWPHRLEGPCRCGQPHTGERSPSVDGDGPLSPPHITTWRRAFEYVQIPQSVSEGDVIYRQTALYAYRKAAGEPWTHEVRRYDTPDGRDKTYRPYSQHTDGLWVMAQESGWPLYNYAQLINAPVDEVMVFVEGEKCAEATQIALNATNRRWVVTTTPGGAGQVKALPPAMFTPVEKRRVVILRDADSPGEGYANEISNHCRRAGALRVVTVLLPGLSGKSDVYDWLSEGHTGAELVELIESVLASPETPSEMSPFDPNALLESTEGEGYRSTPKGLRRVRREVDQAGEPKETLIPLTNFNAHIVSDTLEDDGAETRRTFDVEAVLCVGDPAQRKPRQFTLLSEQFNAMSWPSERLGAAAIVFPGNSAKEHARVAIQTLSGVVCERRVFTHTGWRQIDGEWFYLHAGGAIGATGAREDIAVSLPGDLAHFELPAPPVASAPHNNETAEAIRASIRMLEVAPIEVTAPLFAAIWRAALGGSDFSVHISGQTGEGKSELAALAQQHFGPLMDARHLPTSWSSSGNALESLAFHAKDTLLVVDDFIPTGSTADAARLHKEADRLLRAQGNHSGRQRMRADTTLRPAKPPRGMILSTGEDTPRGTSLRARMVVVDHAPGTMRWQTLSKCQRDAASGSYALAMAAYVQWVAERYEDIQAMLRPQTIHAAASSKAGVHGAHKRTTDSVVQLEQAVLIFARFASAVGALTAAEADTLQSRIGHALVRVGEKQNALQSQGEPTQRFLTLLGAAITSGDAHVADKDGGHPGGYETSWGWREQLRGTGENAVVEWVPLGRRVGWLDGDNLYIVPDAAYAAAQRIGQTSSDALLVTPNTLWKRLHERGLLLSCEEHRQTLKVRISVEGHRPSVLHLSASALFGVSPDDNPTNPTNPANHVGADVVDANYAQHVPSGGQVLRADFAEQHVNPTSGLDSIWPDSNGASDALVGLGRFCPRETGTPSSTASADADAVDSSDPTRDQSVLANEVSNLRATVLALASSLGWPDMRIAPHLRISNERGWRSVARAGSSDPDVARAYVALEALANEMETHK